MNRETWLMNAIGIMRPMFEGKGYPLPERIRVTAGWPSKSALSAKKRTLGEAWSYKNSADGTHETIVSLCLDDPIDVLAVLVHELCHHAVGIEAGHKGAFKKCATAMGLVGKMTATEAGDELKEELRRMVGYKLKEYPHSRIEGVIHKKAGTRMLKIECPTCGCILRTTQKWIDAYEEWTCPCGDRMEIQP